MAASQASSGGSNLPRDPSSGDLGVRDWSSQRSDAGGGRRPNPSPPPGQTKRRAGEPSVQQGPAPNAGLASISHYPSAFHQPAHQPAHPPPPMHMPPAFLPSLSNPPRPSPPSSRDGDLPSVQSVPIPHGHASDGARPVSILVSHYSSPREEPSASPVMPFREQQQPSPSPSQGPPQEQRALPPKPKKRGHSEIERNRREAINDRISDLKDVLAIPPNAPTLISNKTSILGTAVEQLTTLVLENKSLKMELDQLQRELSKLRVRAEKSQRAAAHAGGGSSGSGGKDNGSSSSSTSGNGHGGGGNGIASSNGSWSNGNGERGEAGRRGEGGEREQRPGSRSGSDDSSEDAGMGSNGDNSNGENSTGEGSNGNGSPPLMGDSEESPPRTHSNAASAGTSLGSSSEGAAKRAAGPGRERRDEAEGGGSRPSSTGSMRDDPPGEGSLALPEGPARVSPSAIWAADCEVERMGAMDSVEDMLTEYPEGPQAAASKRPLTLQELMHAGNGAAAKSPLAQAGATRPTQSSPHGSSSSGSSASGSGSQGNGNGSSGSAGHGSRNGHGSTSSGTGNGANGSSSLSGASSRTPPELRSLTLGPEREFLKRGELGSMSGMIVSTTGPNVPSSNSSGDNDDSKSSGGSSSSGARTPLSSSSGNGGKGNGNGSGSAAREGGTARSKQRERARAEREGKKRAGEGPDAELAAPYTVSCRGFSEEMLASTARRLGRTAAEVDEGAGPGPAASPSESAEEAPRGRAEAAEAMLSVDLPMAHVSMRQFFAINLKMALDALLVADEAPDGSGPLILYASDGLQRLTGFSAGELLCRPLAALQGGARGAVQGAELAEAAAQARLDGVLRLAEVVCVRKDGRPFWALACLQPVRDSGERTTGLVLALMDVTGLKRPGFRPDDSFIASYTGLSGGEDGSGGSGGFPPAYQSGAFNFSRFKNLSAQQPSSPEGAGEAEAEGGGAGGAHHGRLLQALASLLAMALSTLLVTNGADDDYRIAFTTPGYQMMTGYSKRELLGKNCRMLQGRDTDRAACRLLKRHLASGERSVLAELVNYRKDGGAFVNLMHIVPIPSPSGQVTRYVSVHTDVTAFAAPRPGPPAPTPPGAWPGERFPSPSRRASLARGGDPHESPRAQPQPQPQPPYNPQPQYPSPPPPRGQAPAPAPPRAAEREMNAGRGERDAFGCDLATRMDVSPA
eukprot:tig00000241_g20994.t1